MSLDLSSYKTLLEIDPTQPPEDVLNQIIDAQRVFENLPVGEQQVILAVIGKTKNKPVAVLRRYHAHFRTKTESWCRLKIQTIMENFRARIVK